MLAIGRAFLTVSGLIAIYIDPTEPERLAELTYAVLFGYTLYSLIVLAFVHRTARLASRDGEILHGIDILWTAALTFISSGPVSPFFLFFLFIQLAAAYRWGFRQTLLTTAITVGIFLIETAVAGTWNPSLFPWTDMSPNRTILRVTYFVLTGCLIGYLAKHEKELRSEIAGAAERARVARELHDGAIQSLFGIEMKVEALRRRASGAGELEAELGDIQRLLQHEVLELRELMQALRPIELETSDQLPDVLASLVERFRRDTGVSARFVSTGKPVSLPASTALELARIVQEALVNVRKHSRARNVLVRLTTAGHTCTLVIEDDGQGFNFEGRLSARELEKRRIGPAIIKERARIAGAQLAVDSTPGLGARLELTFEDGVHA